MASNLNLGTFPVAEGWTSCGYRTQYFGYTDGVYYGTDVYAPEPVRLEVCTRYTHPPLKSAEVSAAVFKRAFRLTPNQLLGHPEFLKLARQAVADGKVYTSDLLKWEDKATVRAAVDMLRTGLARKAASPVATGTDPLTTAKTRRLERLRQYREFTAKLQSARPLSSMSGTSTGTFRCGAVLVEVSRTEDVDWDRYSKSWHRNYGPAKTVSTKVRLTEWAGAAVPKRTESYYPAKLQHIDRRAMEYLADFLKLPKQRGQQGLRINPHVTLAPVESTNRHTRVYRREFGGEVLGFVAVRRGEHFHADTLDGAVDGVREKIARGRLRTIRRETFGFDLEGQTIGAVLRGLGFCKAGVADALDTLGLEDREYEPAELLREADLSKLPAVAKKYPSEVRAVRDVIARLPNLPQRLAELVG